MNTENENSDTNEKKKFHKRRVIVDLKFQTSLISSFFKIYLISTAGFYLILSVLLGKITMFAKENNNQELINYLKEIESSFLWLFFGIFILSSVITYFLGFRITQKISGPIVGMKLFFNKIKDGEDVDQLTLRKDDYFLDLQDSINEAVTKLK